MSDQPEALRLAAELDAYWGAENGHDRERQAAAELRRLSKVEAQRDALRAELKEATEAINDPAVNNLRTLAESIRMLSNQRDALLEALKLARSIIGHPDDAHTQMIDAAITAVEEEA